jgi:hypothetical protein
LQVVEILSHRHEIDHARKVRVLTLSVCESTRISEWMSWRLTFHSPSLMPLLPMPTLSAGEHKVNGGESRVSRQVRLPHNLRAPRSKPKMASLYFWRPSQDSCHVAMVEPPVSYLELTVPAAACEIAISIRTANYACFYLSGAISSSIVYSCTISARLLLLWQEKRLLRTSWTLALQRIATREGHTGKKTVDETAISTGTRPGKIKMQRWISM